MLYEDLCRMVNHLSHKYNKHPLDVYRLAEQQELKRVYKTDVINWELSFNIDDGYISKNEVYNYQYGIVDVNQNKRIDSGDAFFINTGYKPRPLKWGNGYEWSATTTYFHKIYDYTVNPDGTINFAVDKYSFAVWYDYDFDGVTDYVTNERKNNAQILNKIFRQYKIPEKPTKIERLK